MKKLIIYVSALLLTTACTTETEPELGNEPKAIQLSAGILQTKAPIDQDTDGTLKTDLTGVQFLQADSAEGTVDWTSATTAFVGTIAKGEGGTISFPSLETHPHYPTNAATTTNIMGYYPAATSITEGNISITITGEEDVLYASAVSGSKATPVKSSMLFKHKLTQFKVVVKRAEDVLTDASNINVTVKNANTTFKMAIASGIITDWGLPQINTIKPVDNQSTTSDGYTSKGIMLQPELSTIELNVSATNFTSKDITFKAVNNIGETGDTIKFGAGKSYTLTITFGAKDITGIGASIGKWEEGPNPGEGTVTE